MGLGGGTGLQICLSMHRRQKQIEMESIEKFVRWMGLMMWAFSFKSISVAIAIHPTGIFYFIIFVLLLIILLLFLRKYRRKKTIK